MRLLTNFVAQYFTHSTGGCATSRRVSIIQARAFSAVRGSDVLFPNHFGKDLLSIYKSAQADNDASVLILIAED